jgi:hypothetical protein
MYVLHDDHGGGGGGPAAPGGGGPANGSVETCLLFKKDCYTSFWGLFWARMAKSRLDEFFKGFFHFILKLKYPWASNAKANR